MKGEHSLRTIIYQFQREISYYSQRQLLSGCPYDKAYYERLIIERTEVLINLIREFLRSKDIRESSFQRQKEFTLEELSNYDGRNGKAAYVAVNGIVYDVSKESTWGGGTHFALYAGKDLSSEFMGCHKGMVEILNRLPQVGLLKK